MIDPNLDGITHVNIYSQGKTELGRMLSNFCHFQMETEDGLFKSVEGLWYWLGLADCAERDELRRLSGFAAKRRGEELKKAYGTRHDDEFERKIIKAIWYKARRHGGLFVGETATLPFEHYYNFNGTVRDVKDKYPWMIEAISKMRDHILLKAAACTCDTNHVSSASCPVHGMQQGHKHAAP